MISSRGRPLTPETKKLVVSVKQYFDRNRLKPMEPSAKRTADALGIGLATVKRIMADYNRNPKLLDDPQRCVVAEFMLLVRHIRKLLWPTLDQQTKKENI